jgi:large subunit ribosomal protein L17
VRSLFIHQSIETTEPKAKAIKPLVDRIISNAKSATAKKLVSQFFNQKDVETKLTDEILPRMTNRISGYTSTVRLGRRMGDGAMLVKMSLLLEDSKKVSKSEAQSVKEEAIIEGEVVKEVKAKKTAKKGAK